MRRKPTPGVTGRPWARGAGAVLLVAALGACLPGGPEDDPQRVHDLRVLAVRLDPPEVEVPLSPGVEVPVTATVLVAAPGAPAVQWTLAGCPEPGDRACAGAPAPDPALAEALAPLLRSETGEVAVDAQGSAVATTSRRLTTETLLALLSDAGLEGLTGARPAFEVAAQGATGAEVAFKRLQVSWPDAAWREVLDRAGVPVCDPQGQPEGCVAYAGRTPNRNPTLATVSFRREGEAGWIAVSDRPVDVAPGGRLRLWPQARSGDDEPYQTLTLDLEAGTAQVAPRQELLIYTWFATAGWFDLDLTEAGRTQGTQNVWEAPSQVPAEGMAVTLWIVLRDSRGGVDFASVPVRVAGR